MASTILTKIAAAKKDSVGTRKKLVAQESLVRSVDNPRPFFRKEGVTLIAECKKGSPSRGILVEKYNPVVIAEAYEKGGADAVSVLTEEEFFFGSDEHLKAVRSAVALPILRKDFVIDPYQIHEAWALGADAILLIAALLDTDTMHRFTEIAHSRNLSVLLEVHSEEEFEKSKTVEADGFGINARNLHDFSMDLDAVLRMQSMLPKNKIAVAESGLLSPESGKKMYDAGFRGFLVGEYFVTADNKEETVRTFRGALC